MNQSLLASLSRIVGRQWVRHRRAELATYAMDGLPTHESTPGVVVMPATPEQVREIVRLLHLVGVPFVARGAGTGLRGGARAGPRGGRFPRPRSEPALGGGFGCPRRGGGP